MEPVSHNQSDSADRNARAILTAFVNAAAGSSNDTIRTIEQALAEAPAWLLVAQMASHNATLVGVLAKLTDSSPSGHPPDLRSNRRAGHR